MTQSPKLIFLAAVLLHAAAAPLAADLRLTGSLLDAGHQPIAGAQVELVPVPSNFAAGRLRLEGRNLPPPEATARADARGRFALAAPQAGVWKVVARAPGKVPMQYGPLLLLEAEELPPVELPADEGLHVRVALDDGRPAAGAWVLASPAAEGAARHSSSGWRPEFRVGRTAADGSLTLPRTAGERLQVNVFTAAGGESAEVEPGTAPAVIAEIRLRPQDRPPVSLQVVQADGTPAEGLLVRTGEQAWPAGVTDAAGTVLLPLRDGEKATLRIVAPDGRLDVFSATRPADGGKLTLTLPPAVRVAGKVIDAAGGKALPDAVVWSQADAAVLVRTDGEGRYGVPVSRKGSLALEARAAGFLPKRLTIASPEIANGRAPTVALDRAGDLRGAVTGPEGKPLPGASVEAVNAGAVGPRRFSPFDPVAGRAVTGPGGDFEIHRLPAGQDYELRVAMSGFFPAAVKALVPSRGTAAPLRVRLQKVCAVQGVVRDAQDKPVAGVHVILRPARRPGREERPGDSPETAADLTAATAESSETGRFSLPASPADEIDLEAGKAGYATARRRGIHLAVPCGAPFDLGPVVLQPGVRLAGRVVDRRDQAVAGAAVFLSGHLPSAKNWDRFAQAKKPAAVSGPDGGFAIDDLPAGTPHDLLVKAGGYLPAELRSVRLPGRGPLRIRLDKAAPFHGRVVDEAGEAVHGARIEATWEEVLPDDPWKRPVGVPTLRDTRSDAEGRFEIPDAPAGTATLAVTAPGYLSISELEVKPPDDPSQEVVLTLQRGARLEGRVTTRGGEPVAGVRISAGDGAALTDADGVYAADNVATGRQEVEIFHPHYRRRSQTLVIEPGDNHFDVVLEGGVTVAGRVVDQDGAPVDAAEVRLTTVSRMELRIHDAHTGADGTFQISPVAAGSYNLEASAAGYAVAKAAQPVTVADQPVDGLEIVLRQGAVLSGHVLGLSPEELAGVAVTAHGEAGEERAASLDAAGRYEVRDLAPGDWTVRAVLWQGQRQTEAIVPVTAADRQLVRDLELRNRVTLTGRVLFGDEPLAGSTVSVRGEHLNIERSVTSGFDGGFILQDLEPDRYWLGVRNAQRLLVHNDTLELTEDRDLTIRLEAATIAGRVEKSGGDPVPGALLTLRPTEGADFLITDSSLTDGSFRIIHVPAGSYRLTARANGYAPAEREIRVSEGEELQGVKISLTATSGLEVRVRLLSGQTPPMIHVLARNEKGLTVLAGSYASKPDGGTDIASLPAGTWELLLSAPGGAVVTQPVTVPGEPLAVTLPGAGRIQARIRALANEGLLATLRLLSPGKTPFWTLGPGGTIERSWTLRGGKGTIEGVPAGQWTVVAETQDGRVWQGTVVTAGDGEVTVSLD